MKSNGFTLIELVVVIAIIVILYSIIMFSMSKYVSLGEDSSIYGSLATLIPAGEAWYNGVGNNSYNGFCAMSNSALANVISQMPKNSGPCATNVAGVCCYASFDGNSWVAFAQEFVTPSYIYCVDSRGMEESVLASSSPSSLCHSGSGVCKCP